MAVAEDAAIESLVLDTAAAVSGVDRRTLDSHTLLLDAGLDSLTLITLLTHVELACEVSFSSEDLLDLLGAEDLGELSKRVARRVDAAQTSESARKTQNLELHLEAQTD